MDGALAGRGEGPRYITNCTDLDHMPCSLELHARDDGRIEVSVVGPSETAVVTPQQAARFRGQLGDLIADALRGHGWQEPSSFSTSGPGSRSKPEGDAR